MILLAALGLVVLVAATVVVSAVFNGYVLSILWGWFMVPVFHLPALSVAPAIGIALVIGYLTKQLPPDIEEKERSTASKIARLVGLAVFHPALVLVFGWVVHKFM